MSSAVKTDATAVVSSSAKPADNSFGAAVKREGGGELNEEGEGGGGGGFFLFFLAYICVKRHFAKFLATVTIVHCYIRLV